MTADPTTVALVDTAVREERIPARARQAWLARFATDPAQAAADLYRAAARARFTSLGRPA